MTTAAEPAQDVTVELPNDPRSPGRARRQVTLLLRGGPFEPLLDDALLLVTELVTNAVIHAGTALRLRVDLTNARHVRFEVSDRNPGSLAENRGMPDDLATHGRGLLLLAALATSWGTIYEATQKSVWFTLAHPDALPDDRGGSPLGAVSAAALDRTLPGTDVDHGVDHRADHGAEHGSDSGSDHGPDHGSDPGPDHGSDPGEQAGVDAGLLSWLLMLDEGSNLHQLDTDLLIGESFQRLCDAVRVESAVLVETDPARPGGRRELGTRGDILAGADQAVDAALRGDPRLAPPEGLLAVPIRVAGELLGVLVLARSEPLDEAAAGAVRITRGHLATLLMEARLGFAAERARQRAEFAAEASELFAGTLRPDHILNLAAQLLVPRFGAWAAGWLLGPREPELCGVAHVDEDAAARFREALGGRLGRALAYRLSGELSDRQTVVLTRVDLPQELAGDLPGEVLAVAVTARRRLVGVLLVGAGTSDDPAPGRAEPPGAARVHSAESVAMLLDLAQRAAGGIDAATLFQQQREVAGALQASLLPTRLPDVDGLEFAARYVAAGESNTVGGDFYDVVALDGGDWAVIVGDVCGRGPEAAAITGLARSVLRVCLRDGRTAAEACARLNREILDLGERSRFCTVVIVVLSERAGTLTAQVTLAGHPFPVLVRPDGDTELLGAPGTPVGMLPELRVEQRTAVVGPGDALVLYTDGVTERRRGDRMLGDDALVATVAGLAGQGAEAMVAALDRMVEDFSGDVATDDLALLVVRRVPCDGR